MEKKNILTLWISPSEEPQGGIYRHQEKGSQASNSWLKHGRSRARTTVKTRLWPRFCGHSTAIRARAPTARCPVAPYRLHVPVLGFESQMLTKSPS